MKKLIVILAVLLSLGTVYHAASAKTMRSKAKSAKTRTSQKCYAHLEFDPWDIVYPPTVKSLGLKGPVKSVNSVSPVFSGQYEEETGAGLLLTFDRQERLTVFDNYDYGDAAGHSKWTFTYDADGRIVSAVSNIMTMSQDCCQDNQDIITDYSFAYDSNGHLKSITEQTISIWGKKVNWPAMHYTATYSTDGKLSEVKCIEKPDVFYRYRDGKEMYSTYYSEQCYAPETYKCYCGWTIMKNDEYSEQSGDWLIQVPDGYKTTAKYITDSYGNWVKAYWTDRYYSGEPFEDGVFRKTTYYDE